jgi:hypothetical protein
MPPPANTPGTGRKIIMRWFGRAPALWLAAALAVVQVIAILLHLSHDVQGALSIIVTALYSIAIAVFTRPLNLSVVTGALSTLGTAAGVLGLHISADEISVFNTALVAVATLALTNLVSPAPVLARRDPRVVAAPAGE